MCHGQLLLLLHKGRKTSHVIHLLLTKVKRFARLKVITTRCSGRKSPDLSVVDFALFNLVNCDAFKVRNIYTK